MPDNHSTESQKSQHYEFLEQATGIEPVYLAWEANALPLCYACILLLSVRPKSERRRRILYQRYLPIAYSHQRCHEDLFWSSKTVPATTPSFDCAEFSASVRYTYTT